MSIKQLYELNQIPEDAKNLKLDIKDGFDGAGNQPVIHDGNANKIDEKLDKMELVGYVINNLLDVTEQVNLIY